MAFWPVFTYIKAYFQKNNKAAMDFSKFREKYPARPPRMNVIKNAEELKQMTVTDGLAYFDGNSGADATLSGVPRVADARGNIYLWAITLNEVPFAEEDVAFGKTLQTGRIKHTNLTGGAEAHCGGELWFISPTQILIGGDSGRYGPNSLEELSDAAQSFKNTGFNVASLGFDEESGYPARILVGEPVWL